MESMYRYRLTAAYWGSLLWMAAWLSMVVDSPWP